MRGARMETKRVLRACPDSPGDSSRVPRSSGRVPAVASRRSTPGAAATRASATSFLRGSRTSFSGAIRRPLPVAPRRARPRRSHRRGRRRKTAAIRNICLSLPSPEFRVIDLCNTATSPLDIYRWLTLELGLSSHRKSQLWWALKTELVRLLDEQRTVPIIVLGEASTSPTSSSRTFPASSTSPETPGTPRRSGSSVFLRPHTSHGSPTDSFLPRGEWLATERPAGIARERRSRSPSRVRPLPPRTGPEPEDLHVPRGVDHLETAARARSTP